VLVAAGFGTEVGPTASAELYDPDAASWTATGEMIDARSGSATLLPDGTVLVAGGDDGTGTDGAYASAELYDPAAGAWTATASMNAARIGHTSTLLDDGRVLVAGGAGADGGDLPTEIYDPDTGS
jgi:N-acetylneuraminic acid mutarotase